MNTSATGGYLGPAVAPAPLEGLALLNFFQAWLVGLSGIVGTLVRPALVPEPANIPPAATAWAAFRFRARSSDAFPYVEHVHTVDGGEDRLQRHEELDLLVSFYDTGVTGQADALASRTRDGTAIPQNLEPLTTAGMGLISVGSLQPVPSLLKERWLYRVDLPIGVRREVRRSYPVLNLLSAEGNIYTDTGIGPFPFLVVQP